jgi:hypothetical protein
MTKEELETLKKISLSETLKIGSLLRNYLDDVVVEENATKGQIEGIERTSAQHRALFLWFGMIEKEAENAGLTWDRVIRHTHQLRITKENLHEACKQLIKALWGTKSTKELKKQGNIDIIIDHFVDLFSKEGLELPPFPHDPDKNNIRLAQHNNLSNSNYPEYTGAPTI